MKLALLLLLFFVGTLAMASGGEGHANNIPTNAIIIQAVNFIALLLILSFLLRKPLKNLFKTRGESFHAELKMAEQALKKAEEKKRDIKERIETLSAFAEENLDKARADAEELKLKIIEDATNLAVKLKIEAERTAQYEAEKASATVRMELLENALESARERLVDKVNLDEQKRLQTEFVEKIQVVQS